MALIIPDKLSGIIGRKSAGKSWAKLAQLFYNNFRPSWAEVSVEIRPMMGLISSVATSSQVGTKLKSLANLARLFERGGSGDLWPSWPQVEMGRLHPKLG